MREKTLSLRVSTESSQKADTEKEREALKAFWKRAAEKRIRESGISREEWESLREELLKRERKE